MNRNIAGISFSVCGALLAAAACTSSSTPIPDTSTSTASSTGTGATMTMTSVETTTTGTVSMVTTGTGPASTGTSTDTSTTGGTTVPLTPTATGYVDDTALDIVGAWYGYGDGWGTAGPPGNCETIGMHACPAPYTDPATCTCSIITFPPPPAPVTDAGGPDAAAPVGFPQSTPGTFCLKGTAAKVVDMGTSPDYSNIFGIGMGFDFNNMGGTKLPYDTTAHKVIGVSFTITGVPTGGVRVEFPTTQTAAGAQDSYAYAIPATPTGTTTIMLTDPPLSPAFTPPTGMTEPVWDPTKLLSIQFHVATNTTAAVDVTDMCVSNFSVITSP